MGTSGNLHTFDSFYATFNPGYYRVDTFYTSNSGGESITAYSAVSTGVWNLFMSGSVPGIVGAVAPVYRYWNPTQYNHFYKTTGGTPSGYVFEGIIGHAYTGPGSYRVPVYKFYNPTLVDHKYKTSNSAPSGYQSKGVAWYSPVFVYGCKDSSANNFNPYANQFSSGCTYNVYGCMDPLASNYNPSANVNRGCSYPTPGIGFSITPPAIIRGETATLSWNIINSTSRSLSGVGAIAANDDTVVSPADDTTYTISAGYYGYTSNSSTKTLIVYIPPIVTLSLDDEEISLGQSTVLRWSTTGDADKNTVSPGIGSSNLTSSQVVSPTVTTEYTASVSGKGGVDSDEITLTVLQPPEVNLTTPLNVSYGNSLQLGYTAINAITSLKIVPYYYSLDGVETIGDDIVLSTDDTEESISVTHTPAWDDRGPIRIEYKLLAEGFLLPDASGIPDENSALTSEDVEIVPVLIDRKPESIVVPESNDLIKDQAPVISPNIDLTTEKLLITSIDIPVEIKSDSPIQVQIDNDGIWIDVENI